MTNAVREPGTRERDHISRYCSIAYLNHSSTMWITGRLPFFWPLVRVTVDFSFLVIRIYYGYRQAQSTDNHLTVWYPAGCGVPVSQSLRVRAFWWWIMDWRLGGTGSIPYPTSIEYQCKVVTTTATLLTSLINCPWIGNWWRQAYNVRTRSCWRYCRFNVNWISFCFIESGLTEY